VKSFSDAADNERKWIGLDALYSTGHHGHNVHYLSTSLAYRGEFDAAVKEARHLLSFEENPREKAALDNNRTAYRQGWFALLRALVMHEKWDLVLDGTTLPEYNKPREAAWRQWALGTAYAAKGDAKKAAAAMAKMDEIFDQYQEQVRQAVPSELRVAKLELAAHIVAARGNVEQALKRLDKVADRQRGLTYSEPPFYPRPVADLIARLAVKAGKLDVAEKAWKSSLEQFEESAIARNGLKEVEAKRQTSSGGGGGR